MSYSPGTWYNELYRIFSDNVLLTVSQARKVGECLQGLAKGEDIEFKLNELYYEVRNDKVLGPALDEYIHAYVANRKEEADNAESYKGRGWFAEQEA